LVTLTGDRKLNNAFGRRKTGAVGHCARIHRRDPYAPRCAEVAEKASTEDPRFEPLSSEELQQATLEVSILSPLQRIRCPDEVVVGKHGLLIELGRRRGLLLPQVATEYGWDRQVFLENTARKAGLPEDAWKDPKAILYTFTAEVVSEEDG
jgi:AmmeMemoRadiSam system protein A